MPDFAKLNLDPAALIALGFLALVLAMTAGLFGWLMTRGGKRSSG